MVRSVLQKWEHPLWSPSRTRRCRPGGVEGAGASRCSAEWVLDRSQRSPGRQSPRRRASTAQMHGIARFATTPNQTDQFLMRHITYLRRGWWGLNVLHTWSLATVLVLERVWISEAHCIVWDGWACTAVQAGVHVRAGSSPQPAARSRSVQHGHSASAFQPRTTTATTATIKPILVEARIP
jgi:hypothetical protein